MEIRIRDFVLELSKLASIKDDEILHYGHLKGWLEDQDEYTPDAFLDKRTCARILHQFMKIELGIPDLEEVSQAFLLKDIYTCRVCTNHVAQIYCREIMEGEEIDFAGENQLIFNMTRLLSEEEVTEIIKKVREIDTV
ncbi:MAG: hypothetical protein MJ179_06815 [Treponema sp.]|nr:hypothetical protein [Treponema sp.]